MRYSFLMSLIMTLVLFSCRKEVSTISTNGSNGNPIPPNPQDPSAIQLKDLVIPNLPSPYYHFEYKPTGEISFVSFASGFFQYNVLSDNGFIKEMRNNIIVNKD